MSETEQSKRSKQSKQGNAVQATNTEQATDVELDAADEGRDDHFMDIDRMINEGLGGGNVTNDNGLIEETSTETMKQSDSILDRTE